MRPPFKTHRRTAHEAGIAIGPILFIIALLAILATAIATGSGTFAGSYDQEQARTAASEITHFAYTVKQAIDRVRMGQGCTDYQVSFENPIDSNYVNSSAPSDHHCHIFDMAGAGMTWKLPPTDFLDTSFSAQTDYGKYLYTTGTCIDGIGTAVSSCHTDGLDNSQLFIFLPYVKQTICQQLNTILRQNATIYTDANELYKTDSFMYFKGSYADPGERLNQGGVPKVYASGCAQSVTGPGPAANAYGFYMVLLVR